ncbi:hypothetical protein [Thioalkalivibrio sp. ALJ16]|uniref:hypothetical protein n=1 Tax=Thioalkalivibrio sp. ALJ16 TaxID=1158762 RepID=UPI00056E2BAC
MSTIRMGLIALTAITLVGCATVPPSGGDAHHVGKPMIRDADGRITGYIDEKRFGRTYIRAPDGRILGTVEEGPGSAPTRLRDTDGRILRQID